MKPLVIILLLFAAFAPAAHAQLTPLDQRWQKEKHTQKSQHYGWVYLQEGSVIAGEITESPEKVSVASFDGNLFVYNRDKILSIEYDPAAKPKNAAMAVILSLVFPGLGNAYAGQSVRGAIYGAIGFAGSIIALRAKDQKTQDVGGTLYLAALVGSCVDAYSGCRPKRPPTLKVSLLSLAW